MGRETLQLESRNMNARPMLRCLLGAAVSVGAILSGAESRAAERPAVCRLTPLHTGVCRLGADHLLGEGHSPDERL